MFDVIKEHLPTVHCYADDTQLYVSFSPNKSTGQSEAVNAIQHCVKDVRNWMNNDKLLLNDDKTEFLMIGTKQQLAKILLLTYKAINGLAPFYLKELINLKVPCKYKLRSDCDGLLLKCHCLRKCSRG